MFMILAHALISCNTTLTGERCMQCPVKRSGFEKGYGLPLLFKRNNYGTGHDQETSCTFSHGQPFP